MTFGPGSVRECLQIPIINDNLQEELENFQVTAQSSNPASIDLEPGEGSAEVCIEDDDCELLISLTYKHSLMTCLPYSDRI